MKKENVIFISLLVICILSSLIFIISFVVQISILGIAGLIIFAFSFTILMLTSQKFSGEDILEESFFSTIISLSKVIDYFNAEGNGLIIPNIEHEDEFLLFIPNKKEKEPEIPFKSREPIRRVPTSKGLLLVPIGSSLVKKFENKLKISFLGTELTDFVELMYQILVEEFNMVSDIYIEVLSNRILVQLVDSIFLGLSWRLSITAPERLTQIGCPLSSAIGCIISKITGRVVYMTSYNINYNKKLTEIVYNLHNVI